MLRLGPEGTWRRESVLAGLARASQTSSLGSALSQGASGLDLWPPPLGSSEAGEQGTSSA